MVPVVEVVAHSVALEGGPGHPWVVDLGLAAGSLEAVEPAVAVVVVAVAPARRLDPISTCCPLSVSSQRARRLKTEPLGR